jgi:hypothetical protein
VRVKRRQDTSKEDNLRQDGNYGVEFTSNMPKGIM